MDSNYDCGGKPGQPHWTEEPKPGVAEAFVRDLLWNDHPECCGSPVVGAEYMGQREMVCCGCPEPALLNDAQIVASLRARFPESVAARSLSAGGEA